MKITMTGEDIKRHERYVGYETWFRDEVQKGLDAVADGKTVSHEEVKNSIRGMGVHVD